jgi:ferredoxin-nitrite reductase
MGEGYDITIGGSQGANPQIGALHRKAVPASDVKQVLKELLIDQFGAKPRQH